MRIETWKLIPAHLFPRLPCHQTNKPTLFTWEFVAPYLDPAAVFRTLNDIAALSGPGAAGAAPVSMCVFDYIYVDLLKNNAGYVGGREFAMGVKAVNEPARWGLPNTSGNYEALFKDCSVPMKVTEKWLPADLEGAYLARKDGSLLCHSYGFYCIIQVRYRLFIASLLFFSCLPCQQSHASSSFLVLTLLPSPSHAFSSFPLAH